MWINKKTVLFILITLVLNIILVIVVNWYGNDQADEQTTDQKHAITLARQLKR